MKFKVITAGYYYPNAYERANLENLGFVFLEDKFSHRWYIDDNYLPEIEINSLEELLKFRREWGRIILDNVCVCKDCLTGDSDHTMLIIDDVGERMEKCNLNKTPLFNPNSLNKTPLFNPNKWCAEIRKIAREYDEEIVSLPPEIIGLLIELTQINNPIDAIRELVENELKRQARLRHYDATINSMDSGCDCEKIE